MVVVATAKSTKLETAVGVEEDLTAIQQGHMHLAHEQVMTSCWCERHSCVLSSTFSSRLLIITVRLHNRTNPTAHLAFTVTVIPNSHPFFRLLLKDHHSSQWLPMDLDSSIQGKSMHVLSL